MFRQMEKTGVTHNGKLYFPKVVYVSLAEIEEAGDILGLPDSGEAIVNQFGERVTQYDKPAWWPSEKDGLIDPDGDPDDPENKRPVILLIDDFNRADPRILKAIMRLLQDYGTNAHRLPEWTTIGLTGNPPSTGGDDATEYMVNEIDKAILTRMIHISMKFDKVDWSVWAESNDVDKRVINFVLRYPELFNGEVGERTNPRSAVQFATSIAPIEDLVANAEMLSMLSRASLDDEVATAFEKFVIGDMQKLVEPEEIINSWKTAEVKLGKLKKKGKLREDLMGIIVQRMYSYMMNPKLALTNTQQDNFLTFIQRSDYVVEDAMYMLLRMLRKDGSEAQEKLFINIIKRGGPDLINKIKEVM